MAILVTLGAGMDLKKEGFIKKQQILLMFSVTNMIIGKDFKFTANKENIWVILTFYYTVRLMLVE